MKTRLDKYRIWAQSVQYIMQINTGKKEDQSDLSM